MCFLELEETTWADWKECLVVEVALVVEVSRTPLTLLRKEVYGPVRLALY